MFLQHPCFSFFTVKIENILDFVYNMNKKIKSGLNNVLQHPCFSLAFFTLKTDNIVVDVVWNMNK